MKNVKQIRENYDLITEKEEAENRKLTTLVRAGLYDAKKLPALKKALEKSADKMTGQEKRMLLNLLDSLINQVVGNDQVFRKVKQNVQHVNEAREDHYSKLDPRFKSGFPSDKDIPTVLILKRKAIRVYPDNQKVALYYSQALDKYVTIPFSDIQTGINEEVKKKEEKKKRGVGSLPIDTSSAFKQEAEKKEKAEKAKQKEREKYSVRNLSSRGHNVGGIIGIKAGMAAGNIARAVFAKRKAEKQSEPVAATPASAPAAPVKAARPKKTTATKPARRRAAKTVLKRRSPEATKKIIQKNPNIPRSAEAMKHAGLTEAFKYKLQMMREDALDMLDARYGPMYSGSLWDTQGRGLAGGGAGRRAGASVIKKIQKKPTLDNPANNNTVVNKSKSDVLKSVKDKINQRASSKDAKVPPANRPVSQSDLKIQTAKPTEKPAPSPGLKTVPSFEKTGRGNAPAAKTVKQTDSKSSPSFEKTGRGNAPAAPAKPAVSNPEPKKTEIVPGKPPEATPAPQKKTVETPTSKPNDKPNVRPTTEPRDKPSSYQSKAEKVSNNAAVEKAKNDSRSRPSGPKTRKRNERGRRPPLELALAAGAAAATGAAATYDYKLKADTKNAWDLRKNDLPDSVKQRTRQANMKALQQTNESVLSTLQNMIESSVTEQTFTINEQEININSTAAKKILYVYESVNSINKKKIEKMLNESAETFNKVLTFAIRQ